MNLSLLVKYAVTVSLFSGICCTETPTCTSVYNGRLIGYFENHKVVYAEAVKRCGDWNASLVTIKDNSTMQHIIEHMPTNQTCNRSFYYIGLYRKLKNSTTKWIWSDNTTIDTNVNYTNWKQRAKGEGKWYQEPNGLKDKNHFYDQHAVQIWSCPNSTTAKLGDWFDKPEDTSKWHYICEKPFNTSSKDVGCCLVSRRDSSSLNNDCLTSTTTKSSTTTQGKTTTKMMTTTKSTTTIERISTTEKATTTKTLATTDGITTALQTSTNPSTTESSTTAMPTTTTTKPLTILGCFTSMLSTDQGSDSLLENNDKCNDLFGSKFNLAKWESNISEMLARIMLAQNGTRYKTINFTGILIRLHKVASASSLDDLFNATKESKSNDVLKIDFEGKASNRFEITRADLSEISGPFAIVSAAIKPELWQNNNLENLKPAKSIDLSGSKSNLESNIEFQFLPPNENILSLSVYTMHQQDKLMKKSIPVQPFINPRAQNSLLDIVSNSTRQIALNGITHECVFVDTSEQSDIAWSKKGCQAVDKNDGVIHCECSHTTTFGVLLAVRVFSIPTWVTTLLIVLEVFTILALILTVTLLLWLREKLHSDRTVIQINLAASLLLMHLFFVVGNSAAKEINPSFCEASAVLAQFFTFSTAFWMLNEGIVLFFKTYKNALSFNVRKIIPYLAVLAWGFPFVYVLICASAGLSSGTYLDVSPLYQANENKSEQLVPKYNRCWLSITSNMIYTVVVPIAIILILTSVIIIKIAIAINNMSKEVKNMQPSVRAIPQSSGKLQSQGLTSNYEKTRKVISKHTAVTFRAVVMLLPVLGVPWIFGFMVNIPRAEVAFIIINGLLNGLQGIFLFYIYCIHSAQFRRIFCKKWNEISTQNFGSEITYSSKQSRHLSHATSHT